MKALYALKENNPEVRQNKGTRSCLVARSQACLSLHYVFLTYNSALICLCSISQTNGRHMTCIRGMSDSSPGQDWPSSFSQNECRIRLLFTIFYDPSDFATLEISLTFSFFNAQAVFYCSFCALCFSFHNFNTHMNIIVI